MPEKPRPSVDSAVPAGAYPGEGAIQNSPASQADYDEDIHWSRLSTSGEVESSASRVGRRAKVQFGDTLCLEDPECFERGKFWRLSGGPIIPSFPHPLLPR
jgi:hypothetical protein